MNNARSLLERKSTLYIIGLALLLALYCGLGYLRYMQPVLQYGSTPSTDESCYLLEGIPDDNGIAYRFISPTEQDDRTLMITSTGRFELYVQGIPIETESTQTLGSHVTVLGSHNFDSLSGVVNIVYRSTDIQLQPHVYLADEGLAQYIARMSYGIEFACLGILFTLAVNGITMLLFKRSETYLLGYTLYAVLLFLWAVLLIIDIPSGVWPFAGPIRHFCNILSTLMSIYVGFDLLGLAPGGKRFPMRFGPSILAKTVLACIVAIAAFSIIPNGLIVLQWLFALLGMVAGIYAMIHIEKGNALLTFAFLVTQVLRANSSALGFLGLSDSYIYAALFMAPLFDLPCLFGFAIATNRKFAQKFTLSEELVGELDQRVAQRTDELVQNQAQKHQFMMNIFHDLRSPLFVSSYAVQSLEEHEEPEKNIKVLHERIDFMESLVEDLFLMAKLESNRVLLSKDPIDLEELLDDTIAASEVSGKRRRLGITFDSEGSCLVEGDRHRLMQAFQNLLSNAVSFAPEDTSIEVVLTGHASTATVSIVDHGMGLTAEEKAVVFDQYYSKSKTDESTGLGLSIAQAIVELHDGVIHVESEPGKGATFVVELPALSTDGEGGL